MTITLEGIESGSVYRTPGRTITEADIVLFAGLSGDHNPLHTDEEFARTGPFGQRVAHGMLTYSISVALRSPLDDWALLAFVETSRRFRAPTFIGDTIHLEGTVREVRPSATSPGRGTVVVDVRVVNQRGQLVQEGHDVVLVATRTEDDDHA